MYGFGDVWLDQNVTNEKEFITEFEIRIKDCELQTWSAKIKTVPKLKFYCMYYTQSARGVFLLLVNISETRLHRVYSRFIFNGVDLGFEVDIDVGVFVFLDVEVFLDGSDYNKQKVKILRNLIQFPNQYNLSRSISNTTI